jgi:hypothetical protein
MSTLGVRSRDKGKMKAADIHSADLPAQFAGSDGIGLAQMVLREQEELVANYSGPSGSRTSVQARLADLEYKV